MKQMHNLPEVLTNAGTIACFQLARLKYWGIYGLIRKMPYTRTSGTGSSQDYWDRRAKSYGRQYGRRHDLPLLRSIIVHRFSQIRTVTEFGCGTGTNLSALARQFPEIRFTGVDHSERMLEVARTNLRGFPNVALRQADLENVHTVPKERQDLVFTRSVLQHITPNGVRALLEFTLTHTCRWFYLEELQIRGYGDGVELRFPGFPNGLFYNHHYDEIVVQWGRIKKLRYKRLIIIQLLAMHGE